MVDQTDGPFPLAIALYETESVAGPQRCAGGPALDDHYTGQPASISKPCPSDFVESLDPPEAGRRTCVPLSHTAGLASKCHSEEPFALCHSESL